MKVWTMQIAFLTSKAKNTHSEYVILIAFPLQQWLHDRASLLRYTYIVFLYHLSLMLVLSINILLP